MFGNQLYGVANVTSPVLITQTFDHVTRSSVKKAYCDIIATSCNSTVFVTESRQYTVKHTTQKITLPRNGFLVGKDDVTISREFDSSLLDALSYEIVVFETQ